MHSTTRVQFDPVTFAHSVDVEQLAAMAIRPLSAAVESLKLDDSLETEDPVKKFYSRFNYYSNLLTT